jgi:uncharacterized protein
MTGRVVHFEIPYDDQERASSFYRDIFGWKLQSMPEMSYTMVSTGPTSDQGMPAEPGFIGGGMMSREDPISSPVITIEVDDVDGALTQIEQNGGKTVRPKMAVGDMGFAAYFTDCEGNLLGLWQNAQPQSS